MIIVVMGVSGNGKSTIGRLLSKRLGWPFLDADDFHPQENIAKMAGGTPLNDDDRRPWLDLLREELRLREARGECTILACSALKRSYRRRLEPDTASVQFVHLQGDRDLIQSRIEKRSGHFMPAALLDSQFADLEPPRRGLEVSIDQTPAEIATQIIDRLALGNLHTPGTLADALEFPNGMAITADGGTLVLAENDAARLTAFDIGADGQLERRRVWADLDGARPDGLCLAVDGSAWVTAANIRQVLHVREGGEILERVFTRGWPIACTLGGDGQRQLYISTAETDNPDTAITGNHGRIECVTLG